MFRLSCLNSFSCFLFLCFHVFFSHTNPSCTFLGPFSASITVKHGLFELETDSKWKQEGSSSLDWLHPSREDTADDEVEELDQIKFRELLALNRPDWYLVLLGVICATLFGITYPFVAVICSKFLEVGAAPKTKLKNHPFHCTFCEKHLV